MKVIKDAILHTIVDGKKRGSLLIEDKEIKEIGKNISYPKEAEIIELNGKHVYPGFIDAHTHLGIWEDAESWQGNDTNEIYDPINPHLRVIDGIYVNDLGLQDSLKAGVTTVNVTPGSANPIGGQQAALKVFGSNRIEDLLIKQPSGMKFALGENPKRVHREQKEVPSSRMTTAALIRENLYKAHDYLRRKKKGGIDERKLKYEALEPILNNELTARIHAHRADDISTAIRIAEEFDLNYAIDHCTEGHKLVDLLSKKDMKAVIGPQLLSRTKREVKERSFKTASVLSDKGVEVCITSDSPETPIQYLPFLASLNVREGMEEEKALKAITINPAKLCGIDDKVGSLEENKDADLVVTEDDVLDPRTKIEKVFLNGNEIDLKNLPTQGTIRTY